MRIALVVALLLGGCVETEPQASAVPAEAFCDIPKGSCRDMAPPWCKAVCDSCLLTWCAPVGASCSTEVTRFCTSGLAWCDGGGTCRSFCAPARYPRCPAGQAEHHEKDGSADVCTCVP